MSTSTRIHPLVAIAAIAVILLSGVGIAKMLNWLPASSGTEAAATQADTGKDGKAAPEAAKVAAEKAPAEPKRSAEPHRKHPVASTAGASASTCARCGVVTAVTPIAVAAQPSGLGAVAGAILGGVIGHQIGNGKGRDVAAVAGALGGGYAGNTIEGKVRTQTTYRVSVRFDDGHNEHFTYPQNPGVSIGTPVREEGGQLVFR